MFKFFKCLLLIMLPVLYSAAQDNYVQTIDKLLINIDSLNHSGNSACYGINDNIAYYNNLSNKVLLFRYNGQVDSFKISKSKKKYIDKVLDTYQCKFCYVDKLHDDSIRMIKPHLPKSYFSIYINGKLVSKKYSIFKRGEYKDEIKVKRFLFEYLVSPPLAGCNSVPAKFTE